MRNLDQLENYTENLLLQSDLFSAPIDLSKLLRALQIIKDENVLDDGVWGLAVKDGTKKIISVNKNQSENRKRFTIAHELAHIILDCDVPLSIDSKIFYRNGKTDWREVRANYFASCLLMPKKLLIGELSSISPKLEISDEEIDFLARRFRVSPQAMYIRLEQLHLIKAGREFSL